MECDKIEIKNIKASGERAGLKEKALTVFVLFFSRRFPNESNRITSYVDEWAGRFKSEHPELCMDDESKSIYIAILRGD